MAPVFLSGDYVLCLKAPRWSSLYTLFKRTFKKRTATTPQHHYRIGDVLLVAHPRYELIVKRVAQLATEQAQGYWLSGDNLSASVSQAEMGIVSEAQVLGKVIWHIRNPEAHKSAQ